DQERYRRDGVSDGDWKQRREFTYSVRTVLRVMPPYNLKALNDDYQDARVLAETKDYVELEVIAYPLNTNADAIQPNVSWKKDYAGMKESLAPGLTTNWDAGMREDCSASLKCDPPAALLLAQPSRSTAFFRPRRATAARLQAKPRGRQNLGE